MEFTSRADFKWTRKVSTCTNLPVQEGEAALRFWILSKNWAEKAEP